ncbi:helix-turn-helix transcriptional regulator [bacterium]|nr:helix-turn-helix transcriptional regulator [bacterium]
MTETKEELLKQFYETGFEYTLSLINGKYKLTVLYALSLFNVIRYNEMKRLVGVVSHKTLSTTLKELEKDDLIIRKEYPQIPPKVEYSLSKKGASLIPILNEMCIWGKKHKK